ncbi:MAG: Fur family transcriptional regulator [Porticoccaceae bacterium]
MLTNSKQAYQAHDHSRCLNAALTQAINLCQSKAAKLTPIRESVLRLIWQNHRPLGAYAIIDELSRTTGKRVLPPTVYRALDFLRGIGLIHRLASLNAFIGCPFPDSAHSDLFLVCRQCGGVAECSAEGINNVLSATAQRAGFIIESKTVELLGLCSECQGAAP